MKKAMIAGLLAVLLAGCGPGAEATPTVDWSADYMPVVSVTGEVVPAAWADVSAQGGGTVIEVLVQPGDEVAASDLLAGHRTNCVGRAAVTAAPPLRA